MKMKIADLGMTRNINEKDYYRKAEDKMSFRWMAPEALKPGINTTQSDV